jgi:hypothetical protein
MSPDVFQLGPFAPGPFVSAQQLARQARGLNENYGRELMELHTLGCQWRLYAAGRDRRGPLLHGMDDSPAQSVPANREQILLNGSEEAIEHGRLLF